MLGLHFVDEQRAVEAHGLRFDGATDRREELVLRRAHEAVQHLAMRANGKA